MEVPAAAAARVERVRDAAGARVPAVAGRGTEEEDAACAVARHAAEATTIARMIAVERVVVAVEVRMVVVVACLL